jgi:hypothetical protein
MGDGGEDLKEIGLKGRGFSRAEGFVEGHDFSRAVWGQQGIGL